MDNCLHHSDPTICRICNRPKQEVLGWKLSQNDDLTQENEYYGRTPIGSSIKQPTKLL